MKHDYRTAFSNFIVTFVLTLGFGSLNTTVFAQAEKEIVAVVNGKNVTQSEVDSFIPSHYLTIEPQQLHALRKMALENLITRRLLEEEAKRRKVTVGVLRKRITVGRVEISNDQVEREYLENARYFGSMSPDEAKERLRLDLESEARMQFYRTAISKLRAKAKVEIRLKEPQLQLESKSLTGYPWKGSNNARVTIIEFSDFRCPYCRESQNTLKKVMAHYEADVKLVYRHLPLQTNSQALVPAIAAYCASEQGRFWELHDSLFISNDLSLNSIKKLANEINMDSHKFNTCLDSETSRIIVLNDLKDAVRLGITGTPTFIINGRIYTGKLDFSEFKTIIERELELFQQSMKN